MAKIKVKVRKKRKVKRNQESNKPNLQTSPESVEDAERGIQGFSPRNNDPDKELAMKLFVVSFLLIVGAIVFGILVLKCDGDDGKLNQPASSDQLTTTTPPTTTTLPPLTIPLLRPPQPSSTTTAPIVADLSKVPEDDISRYPFDCGIVHGTNFDSDSVGGGDKYTSPWIFGLINSEAKGKLRFLEICSGTIISPRHVITSMTCLKGMSEQKIKEIMSVKIARIQTKRVSVQKIDIAKVRYHPLGSTEKPVKYDISLLTLQKTINMNDNTIPACLPKRRVLPRESANERGCYTQGRADTEILEEIMKQSHAVVISQKECNGLFGEISAEPKTGFCAIGLNGKTRNEENEKELCFVHSGGPMACEENKKWILYGVASTTQIPCKRKEVLYSQVSYSVNWLCCFLDQTSSCKDTACDLSLLR